MDTPPHAPVKQIPKKGHINFNHKIDDIVTTDPRQNPDQPPRAIHVATSLLPVIANTGKYLCVIG